MDRQETFVDSLKLCATCTSNVISHILSLKSPFQTKSLTFQFLADNSEYSFTSEMLKSLEEGFGKCDKGQGGLQEILGLMSLVDENTTFKDG